MFFRAEIRLLTSAATILELTLLFGETQIACQIGLMTGINWLSLPPIPGNHQTPVMKVKPVTGADRKTVNHERGFTLIELLVVIALIAILPGANWDHDHEPHPETWLC